MQKITTNSKSTQTSSLFFCLFSAGLFGLLFLAAPRPGYAQNRCSSSLYNSLLLQKYPKLKESREKLYQDLRQDKTSARARIQEEEETITIPVVVHVVHNNKSGFIGGAKNPNITDEQIFSQIEVLNEDYRRLGRGFNDHPAGADMNIQFELAKVDPKGNPTDGITRHYSPKESYGLEDDQELKSIIFWPTDRYLNIWVTNLAGEFIGYAQFPDVSDIPGLGTYGEPEETDGIVIDFNNFGYKGTAATNKNYNLGHTTSHEVGHWLGLLHTWGDDVNTDPCGEDYCEDTPPTDGPNQVETCDEKYSYCSGTEIQAMIENFMDYSPDRCMNIFTLDQKARVRKVLEISPRRRELVAFSRELHASNQLQISRFDNRITDGQVSADILFNGTENVTVAIYNPIGKEVLSYTYPNTDSFHVLLDVKFLAKGIYFLIVSTSNETLTKRILVTNE